MSTTAYVVRDHRNDYIDEELKEYAKKNFFVKRYTPDKSETKKVEEDLKIFFDLKKEGHLIFERDDFSWSLSFVDFLAGFYKKKEQLLFEERISGWNSLLILIQEC